MVNPFSKCCFLGSFFLMFSVFCKPSFLFWLFVQFIFCDRCVDFVCFNINGCFFLFIYIYIYIIYINIYIYRDVVCWFLMTVLFLVPLFPAVFLTRGFKESQRRQDRFCGQPGGLFQCQQRLRHRTFSFQFMERRSKKKKAKLHMTFWKVLENMTFLGCGCFVPADRKPAHAFHKYFWC